MIQSDVFTVTDGRAPILVPARTDGSNEYHVEITNTDGGLPVTLGGDDIVFDTGGAILLPGQTWYSQSPMSPSDVIYAVAPSGTSVDLAILWVGV